MAILKLNSAYTRTFLMVQSSDHVTGLSSTAFPTVTISKNGGAFAASGNSTSPTPLGNGFWSIAFTTTDLNTAGDLIVHASAASADPTDFIDQVQSQVFTDLTLDASGNVSIASNIKKNQALSGFTFTMTNSTTHVPQTGLTVSAQRSLSGAGFAPCVNSVSELSNGDYTINLAASDLNSAVVMLRLTATGGDDLNILLLTQP